MASIAKRPDGRWRARYRGPDGKERAKHFSRKIDAQRWLDAATSAVVTGHWTDPSQGRITVGDWSQRWAQAQSHLKPSTRVRYAGLLRVQVLPTWGPVPLSRVTHADVAAWVADLGARGLAASTVRQAHRVLALLLDLAVRDGRLPRNPAAGVGLPRAARGEPRFLSHPQVDALAGAAGENRLPILVLAYCGLRFGELAALRVRRVDLLRRRLEVAESVTEVGGRAVFGTPKTHQRRSVPLPRSLVAGMTAHLAGRAPDDFAFPAPRGGVLLLRNWRREVFNPAAAAAGIEDLTPHDLRHTAASLAVAAGGNVKAVQRLLGHASAAMTLDIYAGLFDDDLDAVADRLDEAAARARADSVRTAPEVVPLQSGVLALSPARTLVGPVGLEPTTRGLKVRCSTH